MFLQMKQNILWCGTLDFHTYDFDALLSVRDMSIKAFQMDPWPGLPALQNAVDSDERFGAARHFTLFDDPIQPMPVDPTAVQAIAAEAKSHAVSVRRFVHQSSVIKHEAAVSAALKAFKVDAEAADNYAFSLLTASDVTSLADFTSNSFESQLPLSSPSDDDKDFPGTAAAMAVSAERARIDAVELARHVETVARTAASFGYAVEEIAANGHCGPAALKDQLDFRHCDMTLWPGLDCCVDGIRQFIGRELLGTTKDDYFRMICDHYNRRQFDAAVADWVKHGSWKSEVMNLFMPAAANAFHATILLVRSKPPHALLVLPSHAPTARVFAFAHLLIQGREHFNSLRPADVQKEMDLITLLNAPVRSECNISAVDIRFTES